MSTFKPIPRLMEMIKDLPAFSDKYHEFVLQFDENHYEERVEMAGFTGGELVLDAGCGIGQWSAALAKYNGKVIGIDRLAEAVETAVVFNQRLGVTNTEFLMGDITHLDFPDNTFDYIWCWSVFQFLNRKTVLQEFHRVLKPGGRLMIGCCNAWGRWLYKCFLFLKLSNFQWHQFKVCFNVLVRGDDIEAMQNYTSIKAVRQISHDFGYKLIAVDFDGHIDLSGRRRKHPMFEPRYLFFFENNIEFILEKDIAKPYGSLAHGD